MIGAHRAACLDINVVCSGFVFALAAARGLLSQNPGARALVIGADLYSRILDFTDRRTAVLFARPAQVQAVCRWAAAAPIQGVTMIVVAQQQAPCPGATLNVDTDGKLAKGFRFRPTKDGGYPVGYAFLDSRGGFVYNTLDRGYYNRNWWDRHLYRGKRWEMQTVMKEVP